MLWARPVACTRENFSHVTEKDETAWNAGFKWWDNINMDLKEMG